jgi:thioredoxin reductase
MYDALIVGGGIAGLQAAIQLGRYEHSVLVVDAGKGRSTLCRSYHNLLGWPNGVSGDELRALGRQHAESLGVSFIQDEIRWAVRKEGGFALTGIAGNRTYEGRTLLLATGLMDRIPDFPELIPCLGMTVYVCPDCDGYEIRGKRTLVLGAGEVGANMALTLGSRAASMVYINHEQTRVGPELLKKLKERGIAYISAEIGRVRVTRPGEFAGVELVTGEIVEGERAFVAFGGNEVKSSLAAQLGAERLENRHILTDPRSKMTSVPGVWAAGDVGVHSEQVSIAMGEGAQAAIWMHKMIVRQREWTKQPVPV